MSTQCVGCAAPRLVAHSCTLPAHSSHRTAPPCAGPVAPRASPRTQGQAERQACPDRQVSGAAGGKAGEGGGGREAFEWPGGPPPLDEKVVVDPSLDPLALVDQAERWGCWAVQRGPFGRAVGWGLQVPPLPLTACLAGHGAPYRRARRPQLRLPWGCGPKPHTVDGSRQPWPGPASLPCLFPNTSFVKHAPSGQQSLHTAAPTPYPALRRELVAAIEKVAAGLEAQEEELRRQAGSGGGGSGAGAQAANAAGAAPAAAAAGEAGRRKGSRFSTRERYQSKCEPGRLLAPFPHAVACTCAAALQQQWQQRSRRKEQKSVCGVHQGRLYTVCVPACSEACCCFPCLACNQAPPAPPQRGGHPFIAVGIPPLQRTARPAPTPLNPEPRGVCMHALTRLQTGARPPSCCPRRWCCPAGPHASRSCCRRPRPWPAPSWRRCCSGW